MTDDCRLPTSDFRLPTDMQRLYEILFGLERGFLSREGEFALHFNPSWPWQATIGAGVWNFVLVLLALLTVLYVYRHEGRSRGVRVTLGTLRLALLALVIALLNRPVIGLTQTHTEPSVLAILIDDSVSMRVRDAGDNQSRLEKVIATLDSNNTQRNIRKNNFLRTGMK